LTSNKVRNYLCEQFTVLDSAHLPKKIRVTAEPLRLKFAAHVYDAGEEAKQMDGVRFYRDHGHGGVPYPRGFYTYELKRVRALLDEVPHRLRIRLGRPQVGAQGSVEGRHDLCAEMKL